MTDELTAIRHEALRIRDQLKATAANVQSMQTAVDLLLENIEVANNVTAHGSTVDELVSKEPVKRFDLKDWQKSQLSTMDDPTAGQGYNGEKASREDRQFMRDAKAKAISLEVVKTPEPIVEELTITPEWQQTLDVLNNGTSDVFLTGGAGVGKTTLLHQFVDGCDKNLAVVASTGVAALRAGGQTCHSFFRLDIHALDEDDIKVSDDHRHVNKLKRLETLVVDEVSMLRADTMDAIDITLRKHRKNDAPYGGVRVISVGDPYQLPPVAKEVEVKRFLKDRYGTSDAYFFHSNVFRKQPPVIKQLTMVFRQQGNEQFINALNAIRNGTVSQEHLDLINSRVKPAFVPPTDELWITLTTTNASADIANQAMLDAIKSPAETFTAFVTGNFDLKDAPVDEILTLKVGAAVMFTKNDNPAHRWVNGTLGRITSVKPLRVEVNGNEHPVERETWEKIAYVYDEKTKKLAKSVSGSLSQYPLKLAAAITIHKSQGVSLDRAIVNLKGGVFANGQSYTAFSRLRTLEGMVLRQPLTMHDLMTSQEVVAYMTGRPIAKPETPQPMLMPEPKETS